MFSRRSIFLAASALLCAGSALAEVSKALDPDADGTIDLAEAKKAAGALFDKLDKDHEGTLDIKELHGRVSKDDLAGADPDKDATLTRDEYLSLVETRFKAADPDREGTLDAKELKTPAGKALLKLLK
jgi:Ca2+-binding EF-hand superfamily protein